MKEFGLESPLQERDCLGWKAHSGGRQNMKSLRNFEIVWAGQP